MPSQSGLSDKFFEVEGKRRLAGEGRIEVGMQECKVVSGKTLTNFLDMAV